MRAYLLSRLGQTALVIFLALTAVFFLVRLGGDPVILFLPMDIQAKDINEFRQRLGFNDPLIVQYGRFIGGAALGNFGESLRYKQDALRLVLERLPATLALAGAALLLTACLAIPAGVLSAVRRGSLWDYVGMTGAVLGQAIPGFWLGLMLIYLFSVRLGWLPTGGTGGITHFIMPSAGGDPWRCAACSPGRAQLVPCGSSSWRGRLLGASDQQKRNVPRCPGRPRGRSRPWSAPAAGRVP